MWRLCTLGYRHEPRLILAAFGLALVAALPDALLAFWFKLLGDGALRGDWALVRVAVLALGLSATATWFLVTVSTRVQRRFRDKVTIALESHVATLQASIATIAHHERPEYLDRLSVLRNQVFVLDHMYMSLFSTCGWILRLAVTVALLVSIHPALALLALFALPPVCDLVVAARRGTPGAGARRRGQSPGAPSVRRRHHGVARARTCASPASPSSLIGRRRQAWEAGQAPIAAARWASAAWHTVAWAVFGAGYVGAIVFVSSGRRRRPATCCWRWRPDRGCRSTSAPRSARSASCAASGWTRRGAWPGSRTTPRRSLAPADQPAPTRLERGIRFEHVSFAYPGTDRLVLDDVTLDLPAGTVVAIVGENGAGKTTLVKLLAKLYEPTQRTHPGRRRRSGGGVGRRLAQPPGRRVPGLLPLRVPGPPIGRPRRSAAPRRRRRGVGRGRAAPAPTMWSRGCRPGSRRSSDRRGPVASRSASASGRSWRWPAASCATGRCCWCSTSRPRRSTPKPSTPCSSATRRRSRGHDGVGRITILVSHRFSTVRMADLIVVLDGARVVESGYARRPDGPRRPVRPALRDPGGRVSVSQGGGRLERLRV